MGPDPGVQCWAEVAQSHSLIPTDRSTQRQHGVPGPAWDWVGQHGSDASMKVQSWGEGSDPAYGQGLYHSFGPQGLKFEHNWLNPFCNMQYFKQTETCIEK